ncbi:hypothetical protein LTR35_017169 [Friedmanniomyces endolithicus]|nr:hypothetical protein LTR35_017169 [Friedmanniomyces endolithicus]KAK0285423.1 hypothetical protein LTS00_010784 [Friedmanniomyces endolithicus]KAK0986891.1 hypothetical protein LTR54_013275 [Friedmanniomyces endolithicus]
MNTALLFLWPLATCLRNALAYDTPDTTPPSTPPLYNAAYDNGTFGYYPVRTYVTAEELHSPQVNFLEWDAQCDDGSYYFMAPRGWSVPDPGPMILDSRGELVWAKHFDNNSGGQAYDFQVQTYQGQEYLTFWLGDDRVRGHGSGHYYMLNSSYDTVHRVGAANGLSADLHEFLITPQGTALMTMYEIVAHDVTSFREFDPDLPEDQNPNFIWDCLFQEVDVATGDLVFEWRASDHMELHDTYHGIGPGGTLDDPFDWFHINSIDKDELGNFLVSARYMHSLTYIDGKTGDVIWTLGGRSNAFMDLSDGFSLNFAWQHDARFIPLDTFPNMYRAPPERAGYTTRLVTFFDNAAEDQHYDHGLTYSRGLLLEITYPTSPSVVPTTTNSDHGRRQETNDPAMNAAKVADINGTNPSYTVRVIQSYDNPLPVRSSSQGSMQILPPPPGSSDDPTVLVGYGFNAVFTVFAANGSVLCDAHYGAVTSWERGDIQSYRVYKSPWTGSPRQPPNVDISDDDVEVYISWNGATEVTDWVLQCSESDTAAEQAWADVVRVGKEGFETVIQLPEDVGESRFLRVIALGDTGRRLKYGVSETIDRGILAGSSFFPLKVGSSVRQVTPLKVFLVVVSMLSGMLVLYEGYRRYLSWSMGRPGGSSLRWRQGKPYRLLGEA